MSSKNEAMIAALLRERAGYAQSGKTERLKLVDEQLKLYGYSKSDDPRKAQPEGRQAGGPQQSTARPEVKP